MDFTIEEGHRATVAKTAAFVDEVVAPVAAAADRRGGYDGELLAELGGAGLMAMGIPAEYGGDELGAVGVGLALEPLARADITACWPVLNAALIGGIVARSGTDGQKAAWLPPIARGDWTVALCLTEAEHGTDAAAIEVSAAPDGAGGWVLAGTKTSIMIGALATHGLVFARTGGPGAGGISAFFVDLRDRAVHRSAFDDLGNRAGGRAEVVLDRVAVADENRVGAVGEGFVGVMRGFDYSRALIGMMAAAAGSACVEEALSYARTRTSFGSPLGAHQGVSFPLVDHATRLHAGRLLSLEALWRKDQGLDHRIEANMAKSWVPTAAVEAAHQALMTFGHRGWSSENPVGRRLRDLIGTQIADGTTNATRLVVARQLLGREASP